MKKWKYGQQHHNAKLTTNEVELIRQLHNDGMEYKHIAVKFEVATRTVAAICRYERRAYG